MIFGHAPLGKAIQSEISALWVKSSSRQHILFQV